MEGDIREKSECVAIPMEQEEDKLESSSPFPTHFLCPSNLGAIFESTTVSLVSGGWKDTTAQSSVEGLSNDCSREANDVTLTEDRTTDGDDAFPKLGPHKPNDEEDQEFEANDPSSPDGLTSDNNSISSENLQHSCLPQLAAPAPFDSLTHPLPLPLTASPATPSNQCCNSEVEMHRHQLCIAIDEDSTLKYTPSLCHDPACSSKRSSVCSSAVNDGDIIKHEIRTHSRNVSETPSLPPFHSSSTSSAYHSRNSSLGSQLSSCFESDSMLNQLTDIDSCLAVHTGSHGDLKHLIRKQDSRFLRPGDSSPSSYSSDLSLHHHMSKPLTWKEPITNVTPMNLEETLRNLSLEKLDECKKNISMKSSEWIKHQLECHRDSLVICKVSSKTKHVVHFSVKAGDVIIWEFATKKKDIAFGVFFEATEVATEQSPLPESHGSADHKMSSILPIFRVSTHAHPTVGTHTASLDGIYEIIFDNTYSRFFAKELYYRITTQPSQPNENYLQQ